MTQVTQLRAAATELSPADRAELAEFLLSTLDETHHWVDDVEVMKRRDELDSGAARGLSRSEFNQQCGR
ncbi:hypothetical protein BH11VER1_BH11VER1_33490 [soil metagenome]